MASLRENRFPPGVEPLTGEWEGCYSVHFANDRYRLIWEFDEEIATIKVIAVERKQVTRAESIYDRPRPTWQ